MDSDIILWIYYTPVGTFGYQILLFYGHPKFATRPPQRNNGSSVYHGVSIWNVNICEHHLELEHVPLFSIAMVVY
jgi:hypothetical protein